MKPPLFMERLFAFAQRHRTLLASVTLALAAAAAYVNSFAVPALLDDRITILDNPTLRQLWPLGPVLFPPGEVFSAGRPLLNLSFALNYAAHGEAVGGYHLVNLLLHLGAGLALFGIMRRLLALPIWKERLSAGGTWLAWGVALLWLLHPLQTAAVTYISQRAEVLMGLCYLLTIYCFLRSVTSATPRRWRLLAVATCSLGMLSKEVMATAPVAVWLFDASLVAGSWRAAWQQRWRFHAALASTWLILAALLATSQLTQRGINFEGGFTAWSYALTECQVVLRYLRLAVWPHPLIFDYNVVPLEPHVGLYVAGLIAVVAAAVWSWRRWPAWGLWGIWFLLVLSPTSSVVPVAGQPMAESRLYVPLAALAILGGLGLGAVWGRRSVWVLVALALLGGGFTVRRNHDFRSELSIWTDTVAKYPRNPRAHEHLASTLATMPGRWADARRHFETALQLKADFAEAHVNLANLLLKAEPPLEKEALAHYEAAVQSKPNHAVAHHDLGCLLSRMPGRAADALAHLEIAARLKPYQAETHFELGNVLAYLLHRPADAIRCYEEALKWQPDFPEAHCRLGNLLAPDPARRGEAEKHYLAAVRLDPNQADAHHQLGNIYIAQQERWPEAAKHYEAALRLQPDLAPAHNNLGTILVRQPGRAAEALPHFETALRLEPNFARAHFNLGLLLLQTPGRSIEGLAHLRETLRLMPDHAMARQLLEKYQPK
ncbi:MAG: tetratricopeptide repeat protein [Opitutae bacterium]|nr:tetratricopeptide repeat protein [Opitutae bacterium]